MNIGTYCYFMNADLPLTIHMRVLSAQCWYCGLCIKVPFRGALLTFYLFNAWYACNQLPCSIPSYALHPLLYIVHRDWLDNLAYDFCAKYSSKPDNDNNRSNANQMLEIINCWRANDWQWSYGTWYDSNRSLLICCANDGKSNTTE